MVASQKTRDFLSSKIGLETREKLRAMQSDATFSTADSYTPNTTMYPDNVLSFVDKHMDYLSTHLEVNVQTYLANLRLKTRVRR